jgi:hypothetical protein
MKVDDYLSAFLFLGSVLAVAIAIFVAGTDMTLRRGRENVKESLSL